MYARCAPRCWCSARCSRGLGEARIPLPGGCAIGQRPIDQHLKGMSALGAKVKFDHGGVTLSGRLRGAVIYLDMPSVGATENLLMAATLAAARRA